MSTIKWKLFPENKGYRVSSTGNVESRIARGNARKNGYDKEWRPLKTGFDTRGYLYVKLYVDTKKETWPIHSLVAHVFIGERPDALVTCHNDGNKFNNLASNLRYDTHKSNSADMIKHGNSSRGERQGGSVLTELQVKAIICELETNPSRGLRNQLAHKYGVVWGTINCIAKKKTWSHLNTTRSQLCS